MAIISNINKYIFNIQFLFLLTQTLITSINYFDANDSYLKNNYELENIILKWNKWNQLLHVSINFQYYKNSITIFNNKYRC